MRAPSHIGAYEVVSRLGEGGMGVVYEARDCSGAIVAIKVLNVPQDASEEVQRALRDRFAREASIRIDHPRVLRIYETGVTEEQQPFLVMERLRGQSLSDLIADVGEPIGINDAVSWIVDACDALEALHAEGIIHRDIKPSNLFLCDDGTIKVVDFGVVHVPNATTLTQTGNMVGTLDYLAPEQAEGSKTLGPATDVWALGVVLFELLAGQRPFARDTPMATLVAILMSEPTPLTALRQDVSPGLWQIVDKALRKSALDRWKQPNLFASALEGERARTSNAPPLLSQGDAPLMRAGEQRVVAVVMASELTDFPAFCEAIRQCGGQPTQSVAGSAMGIFGGETGTGDELAQACRAALRCEPFARYVAVSGGRALSDRGAITGIAVQNVEAALKKAQAAQQTGVVISESLRQQLPEQIEQTTLGNGLWRLVGSGPPRARRKKALVGRDEEVALMQKVMQRASEENASQSLLLLGAPGVGKTALVDYLAEQSERRSLKGNAPHQQQKRAFGVWEDMVRQAPSASWSSVIEEWLRPKRDQDLSTLSQTDFQAAYGRLRAALRTWCIEQAALGPVVFVFEDLHRADAESLELLEDIVETLTDFPCVFFLSARSAAADKLARLKEQVNRVQELLPLSAKSAMTLAQERAPQASDKLHRAIVARSGGNPFFIEQLCLHSGMHGDEEKDEGPKRDNGNVLPLTVESLVQARLDELTPEQKRLCQALSTVGLPVSLAELRLLGAEDPRDSIDALLHKGVVIRQRSTPVSAGAPRERLYTFSAELFSDVTYESLLPSERPTLHRRAAAALATRLSSEHSAPLLSTVARHFKLGGDAAKASEHFILAAMQAGRAGDARSVTECAEEALRFDLSPETEYMLHLARIEGYRFYSASERVLEVLKEALVVATTDAHKARVHSEFAVSYARSRAFADANRHAEQAIALADVAGDPDERVVARGRASLVQSYQGRLAEAERLLAETAELEPQVSYHTETLLIGWKAHLAALKGSYKARIHGFEELHRRYIETGNLGRAAGAASNLADTYNRVGLYEKARVALEQAREACLQIGQRVMLGYCELNLGYAHMRLGLLVEANEAIESAQALSRQTEDDRLGDAATLYEANLYAMKGERESARRLAERLDAPGIGRTLRALALALLGELSLTEHQIVAALTYTERAYELCSSAPIEEDEARVYLARIKALEAAGEPSGAHAVREFAKHRITARLAEIDDEELRTSFAEIPEHAAFLSIDER